jgi:hypothetical protein
MYIRETAGASTEQNKWLNEIVIWFVVWNMIFICPYIGNVIIPTDEVHDFSEEFVNSSTTNQSL